MPHLDPARAESFLCQPCSKDEKPWADQLAPADSAPAPVPSQDALPAKPETGLTEAPKPRPSPSGTQWPDAPGLPDDALAAKPEVILKAAPKPRPLPSEPQRPPPGPPPKAPAIFAARSADRSRVSLASKPSMASKEARLHAAAGSGSL